MLLRVVMMNLLENAWKFTRTRRNARIEFTATEQSGQRVCSVHDNGVGYDMRYAGKLFQAFHRFHDPADFEGTGVGLATVQRIIQRHGGRIRGEGAIGRGAVFHFTLPAARPSASAAAGP